MDDQMESESSKQEEFKDFRMIDEIILELENAYPSNSYENIIADHVRNFNQGCCCCNNCKLCRYLDFFVAMEIGSNADDLALKNFTAYQFLLCASYA